MDKYTELLKDIAGLIADLNRENYFLKLELEDAERRVAEAEDKIESVVALRAAEMMRGDKEARHA